MKLSLVLLSFTALAAAAEISDYNPAYGYLRRIGVPAANRIRAREKEYLKNPFSRIFNGAPAILGQFPYQFIFYDCNYPATDFDVVFLKDGVIQEEGRKAGIIITVPFETAVCGAVLVKNNRLLTAAHCWSDGEDHAISLTVVLGSVTIFSGGIRIQTSDVEVHPDWTPMGILNDIAVVRLPSPVTLSNIVNLAVLPSGSQVNELFEGETAIASGFGGVGNIPVAPNQFLSFANVNVISNAECWLSFPFMVQPNNICSASSSSPCSGDSGGPLVVQRNGSPLLIGIVSFGLHPSQGGCEIGYPVAYVRVTSFLSFIQKYI